jgi:DNA-binding NarL/FixJ family response regulator
MDIHMPLLDGIEVTRRIAGPDVDQPPKVLVVTTFNVDEYVYRALRAGASGSSSKTPHWSTWPTASAPSWAAGLSWPPP